MKHKSSELSACTYRPGTTYLAAFACRTPQLQFLQKKKKKVQTHTQTQFQIACQIILLSSQYQENIGTPSERVHKIAPTCTIFEESLSQSQNVKLEPRLLYLCTVSQLPSTVAHFFYCLLSQLEQTLNNNQKKWAPKSSSLCVSTYFPEFIYRDRLMGPLCLLYPHLSP
jgi:hypothetical protein